MRIQKSAASLAAMIGLAGLGLSACATAPSDSARALHERTLTLDTHLDTPALLARPGWSVLNRHDPATDYSQVDVPRMKEGGLDGGFWVIYTPQGPRTPEGHRAARDFALRRGLAIREMIARDPEVFGLALSAADAAPIGASGRRVAFISMENSYPLGRDLTLMSAFYDLGVRMIGPVHTLNNDLADSATDKPEHGGLSALGEEFVREANRLGMVLDASHASDAAFDDMLALSATPLILSHSGPKAVYDHPRNIDDARIKALAAKGGVIQINALGAYLRPLQQSPERVAALRALRERNLDPIAARDERRRIDAAFPEVKADFEDYIRHLLHTLALVGPDHVGIGADWDGGGGVAGMEDVSDLPRITERLIAAGYSEADIAKIWSGNQLRVLKAAEDHAASLRTRPAGTP